MTSVAAKVRATKDGRASAWLAGFLSQFRKSAAGSWGRGENRPRAIPVGGQGCGKMTGTAFPM